MLQDLQEDSISLRVFIPDGRNLSYSRNSLQGDIQGSIIGDNKGDTRSLDYGSSRL